MNSTPLEDQVHDALHRRVDPIQHSPLTVADVRQRARRIQRRRTIAAGAAVAAALAVAVPVGLAMTGPGPRSDFPPATQTPTPTITGPVRIDPRSASEGDGPTVPLVVTGEHYRLLLGGDEGALPMGWDQITPFGDGWLTTRPSDNESGRVLEILNDAFAVEDGPVDSTYFTVSADGTRVAWPEYDGTRWQVVNSDTARESEPLHTTLPDSGEATVRTVGFVSEDAVVAVRLDPDGSETTYVAMGSRIERLPGLIHAVSASPVTGMVAGPTSIDVEKAESCSAAVDGRARTGDVIWETCDHQLAAFSPDGQHLVGLAEYFDGMGSPSLSILDATTGESVLDFELTGGRQRVVVVDPGVVWEDDQTLLATYIDGNQQYVLRLGLDGTVERVAGPVTNDDLTLSLHLTPGRID